MSKLLIADSSDIFMDALASILKDRFHILTCSDGSQLAALLDQYRPDVLILNLLLPHTDGITALRAAAFHPSVIVAVTMHMSSYLQRTVTELGIDYTMIAPSVAAVVQRLEDLMLCYTPPQDSSDLEAQVLHHLRLLNIPTHLTGYRLLCLALPLYARQPQPLTNTLYPEVARLFGRGDSRSVEHAIRKAIRAAWKQRDNAIWRKYFSISDSASCPTNKEFLSRLAEILNTPGSILP